jgi:hypothetical protein
VCVRPLSVPIMKINKPYEFNNPIPKPGSNPPARRLKIEADGDFWKGDPKPKIRLTGRWLARAGFSPGDHVHVTCLTPGVIELRSPAASVTSETRLAI